MLPKKRHCSCQLPVLVELKVWDNKPFRQALYSKKMGYRKATSSGVGICGAVLYFVE